MPEFLSFAGWAAPAAAIASLAYAVALVVVRDQRWAAVALTAVGVLSIATYVGLAERLAVANQAGWTLFPTLIGALAGFGMASHGAFDLARALHPETTNDGDRASEVDPRGFATFGLNGLAALLFSWLVLAGSSLPAGLGLLGLLSGALLIELWLARLIVLDPSSPLIKFPALGHGFIIGPLWLLWVGITLLSR